MKKQTAFRLLLLITPTLLGFIGFAAIDHLSISDALFNCLQMYVINYGESPTNIWVELARWTAPLATAGGIFLFVSSVNLYVRALLKMPWLDTVAVYGPEDEITPILSQLGHRGIRGGERFLPAHHYILMGSQYNNFAFYEEHKTERKGAHFYIRCDSIPPQSVSPTNVHLFQPNEITARLFWKHGDLLPLAEEKNWCLQIAFIGFGTLGEDLLYWGLQNNIFFPKQEFSYHIFGDASGFIATHPMLKEINDTVVIHSEPWANELSILNESDLILVLPQERMMQETVATQLLELIPRKNFIVFTSHPFTFSLLDGQERMHIIDISTQSLKVDQILQSDLIRAAMYVNLRYAHLYNGVEETKENARLEWDKLNAFLRYSNISTADYHEIRLLMLQRMNIKSDGSDLTSEQKEMLSELEHIRWCRYHWLNNWHYGVPSNGSAKDTSRRIHVDLLPYNELSEGEKDKDRNTIDVLLSMHSQ